MKSTIAKKRIMFAICVVPALIVFLYFIVVPFLETFYYCFTDWNGMTKTYNFIGFKNFEKIFKDKIFWLSLKNNVKFCVWGGILTFGIGIFNAVLITQSNLKEKNVYKILFFIPQILSIVAVAAIWKFIYNPEWGILNGLLDAVGLGTLKHTWLGEKSTVVGALIVVWVWISVGFYMVLFIAAIEGISKDVFEAATIDGATSWQQFWTITFPLIAETTKTCVIFFLINAFTGVYSLVKTMTEGGPAHGSEVVTSYMYNQAFVRSKFGLGTAMGVTMVVLVAILSAILLIATRNKDAE